MLRYRPSQPVVSFTFDALALIQMSVERKCDRFGFGYDTPWMMPNFFSSHSCCIPFMFGCSPAPDVSFSADFSGMAMFGRSLAYVA